LPGSRILEPSLTPLAAGAAALVARRLDHSAVAAAPRARLREREQPLALRPDAPTLALRTDRRRGAGPGTRAAALAARRLELDRDARLDALERVLERQVDGDLGIVAALPARRLLLAAAAPVEDPAEEVGQVDVAEVETRPGALAGTAVRLAVAVVLLPLLRVREHVVGGLDLLEPRLGSGVTRILVRVELLDELAVGLLQLGRGRVPLDSEAVVELAAHRTLPRSGRGETVSIDETVSPAGPEP
jgi:hypothetical protein